MGKLTTHVLDTMNGCPAAGLRVTLYRVAIQQGGDPAPILIRQLLLNSDGRAEGPLLEGDAFEPGRYRLEFQLAAYFRDRGVVLPEPAFLEVVPIDFGLADATQHYHVPLLASPWSYSTYRGS